jgi:hypothetical protein
VTQTIADSWLCVKPLNSLVLRAALALVTLVVLAPPAEAQSRFSMENDHPTTNPRTGLSHTYGASLLRPGATETTLPGSFDWATLTLVTTEDQTAGKLVSYAAGLHVMTSIGVTRWFEIGIALPIMLMGAGDSVQGFRDEPLAGDETVPRMAAGPAAARIAVRGAGADEPITFNTSDEGRAANRRAEIRIRAAAP